MSKRAGSEMQQVAPYDSTWAGLARGHRQFPPPSLDSGTDKEQRYIVPLSPPPGDGISGIRMKIPLNSGLLLFGS